MIYIGPIWGSISSPYLACAPWARAVPIGLAVPTIGGSVTYPAHEVLWVPAGRGTMVFQTPFPIENGPKGPKIH